MNRYFTRRAFLRNMGMGAGAALLSPLLARMVSAQSGASPRRFVIVLEGNCAEPTTFLADNARAAFETSTGVSLGTDRWFYRHYDQLTAPLVVENTDFSTTKSFGSLVTTGPNLAAKSAMLFGLSSKITGGGHSTHHGALSCTRSSGGKPGATTIDAYLAALPEVRGDAPFDALRVGISGAVNRPLNYDTCAYDKGRAAAILLQPESGFQTLFGSVASAAGMQAFQNRAQLLDFARADVNAALSMFSGNSQERAKLESYLLAVERVQARQSRLLEMEANGQQLSSHKPTDPETNPLYVSGDLLDRLRAQFELAAAALTGELTHVVVIASGTGTAHFNVTFPGISAVARHDLHHGSASTPSFLTAIHQGTAAHIEMVAGLAQILENTPEPGATGTMLDHTVILFMSDNGEQHHSTASEWPALLMGGGALGLQTGGRTIFYPGVGQSGHRQVSNLFNTLGYCAGRALDEFGSEGPTRVATGPLAEIYG